jgi:hypothetical protein
MSTTTEAPVTLEPTTEPVGESAGPAESKPAKPTKAFQAFEELASRLAVAEERAKAASGDATQARADKSTAAVEAIKSAVRGKIEGAVVRSTLLGAGVPKGTVSKIVTVIDSIMAGNMEAKDVKSLNGAYSLVNAAAKAAKAAADGTGGTTTPGKDAPVTATTPEQAAEIIYAAIRGAGTDAAILSAASEWITKLTDGITAITSTVGVAAE